MHGRAWASNVEVLEVHTESQFDVRSWSQVTRFDRSDTTKIGRPWLGTFGRLGLGGKLLIGIGYTRINPQLADRNRGAKWGVGRGKISADFFACEVTKL